MMNRLHAALAVILLSVVCGHLSAALPQTFSLVRDGQPVVVWVEPEAGPPVARAAGDLAADIARVSGLRSIPPAAAPRPTGPCILVGRVGSGGLIDQLAAEGKIDATALRGAWEASLRTVVDHPVPGVPQALVIAGSDVRGTIFALYDVSEEIGVSPWYWWADVPVNRNVQPTVSPESRHRASPSVQYRGIFINDEDWGLQPWAAKTFEPEAGGIGPKTYARVCELLLRLRANTLWPAMHACSPAFNSNPENRVVADRYGIVMGSSHAEPMLRNNVREWSEPHGAYNYLTNREGVLRYWEQRLQENGRYENIYTIGMRGIHDSRMQGAKSVEEQKAALEKIFADQRALIAKHVNPAPARVPQIFCAYKEVLEVYRSGLQVPDDVTIVFPDDNFGYIRNFPSAAERNRPGGFGVYYHISYLGRPLSYLWLNTTPPALMWSELSKAYDLGARKLWIVNVGDIKPAEIGMEFFLRMAFDVGHWNTANLPEFLKDWAARTFGATEAAAIARVLEEYYHLNFQRKPEHLQWWLPNQPRVPSPLTQEERAGRLERFARLRADAEQIATRLPVDAADAFFQLVLYPVVGSAAANERYFCTEEYLRLKEAAPETARPFAARAQAAQQTLVRETERYNEQIAGGKWRHMMALEPADADWKSMRIAPPIVPEGEFGPPPTPHPSGPAARTAREPRPHLFVERDGAISIPAQHFSASTAAQGGAWETVPGLGRTGTVVTLRPARFASPGESDVTAKSPRLDYKIETASAGNYLLLIDILPTHPLQAGQPQRLGIALDDAPPTLIEIAPHDGTPEWSAGALEGVRQIRTPLAVPAAGRHTLRLFGIDPGVSIDKILVFPSDKPPPPSFLGPEETTDNAAAAQPSANSLTAEGR